MVVQFLKYGVCGGLAVVLYLGITFALVSVFPEWVAESLPDELRARHLVGLQAIAFVPTNIVGYLLNRAFVFTPGRHRVGSEFVLFMVVAVISTGVGLWATDLVVRLMAVPNWMGTAASVVGSSLMNFVCRKFLVFAR